jgi:hypothetical protein
LLGDVLSRRRFVGRRFVCASFWAVFVWVYGLDIAKNLYWFCFIFSRHLIFVAMQKACELIIAGGLNL